jgi:hypothetical protein
LPERVSDQLPEGLPALILRSIGVGSIFGHLLPHISLMCSPCTSPPALLVGAHHIRGHRIFSVPASANIVLKSGSSRTIFAQQGSQAPLFGLTRVGQTHHLPSSQLIPNNIHHRPDFIFLTPILTRRVTRPLRQPLPRRSTSRHSRIGAAAFCLKRKCS